ncbi:MAG: 1,4-alpha-glucan branching protein GlgB, partial [Eubacteriales bacterium]|nr:1,4-alpha-glucan branching protein GlgB [Eubacteriales bacterium]
VGSTGVWEAHIAEDADGALYKYAIIGPDGHVNYKADPYAVRSEKAPGTASMVYELQPIGWRDEAYLQDRGDLLHKPVNIYEVHAGSWRAGLTYRDMAVELVDYAASMGYTHIELMPLCEYPFDMSWGYQITGYYAVTSRYGTPEDLMYLIDCAHQKGIGVLLDWVPAHFPRDEQGLRRFDGTPLYEHPDPRRGEQPQWGTMLFDYSRTQVVSFLISNALFWLKEFHVDGLRVDAVSCMLYLDYGKQDGDWLPNETGGHENLDAIAFLRQLNDTVHELTPGAVMIAEESTAFPLVTAPTKDGGLGFDMKWNMGFMNDMLEYMSMDSLYRKYHHDKLTFSMYYAFSEKYILPFSHDEVVHGKHSMLDKAPGDYWRKFAQLRLLLAYQMAHPGKKLNFMGYEFGQFIEWKYTEGLDWLLLEYPKHAETLRFTKALNLFYRSTPPFYQCDDSWDGFEWTSVNDSIHSVAAFLRRDNAGNAVLCAFNFTPEPWEHYYMGMPQAGTLTEVFSSDAVKFGGTGDWHNEPVHTNPYPEQGMPHQAVLRLPPFGAAFFTFLPEANAEPEQEEG